MSYAGYRAGELKQHLARVHKTINDNRREFKRLIHKIDELTEAIKINNCEKKQLKRELKQRRNGNG